MKTYLFAFLKLAESFHIFKNYFINPLLIKGYLLFLKF